MNETKHIRRIYVRGCKKCGSNHWFEHTFSDDPDKYKSLHWMEECPLKGGLIMVTYRPYVHPTPTTGNWL